ncbi:putative flavonol 3-O-glucosyltransferase [Helianthus annuus]|uniref:Flavonol 3-O-glucosyltransferase n=1 Tax=Helianthus annuus TaxID=4232 RepID=A0A9K3EFH3_HELAN|nr:putative flavonol 3-O-glucosyltransferase [Helianthus annuus]KAJ0476229.1 putative flavonol 3-O-glucosyltransferase [Helianthus annuus]KAJ0480343.1 putative flavonol 3-O-glucosyltransferase [Helianthus annuus]KAJ0497036.1 putative flavonol 3-O-glucosyltransferase [Helianthus annuus]KAJ0670559.1 putative flavonol 3-O-glucosyltransferase [Helianthus annuus]
MIDVANEYNLQTDVYFTSNAAFLGFKLHFETLFVDQKQDLIELANSESEIVIPSFVNPVPMKVFPEVYQKQDGLDFLICAIGRIRKAKGILINTFLELETHVINWFSRINFPPVYLVGPILNLAGVSTAVFSARCLEQSGHRFVWSLRRLPPPEQSFQVFPDDFDDPRGVLPDGFLERTLGIGKVIGWAPQVSLLAHEAVGGFMSHCGWNSMLESLWFGVLMATLPMLWEQQMNAFEMVVELGLVVDLNSEGDVVIMMTKEIERGIRRLMENKEVRTKVKEMSKMSRETVVKGGSSHSFVGYLLKEIMSNVI